MGVGRLSARSVMVVVVLLAGCATPPPPQPVAVKPQPVQKVVPPAPKADWQVAYMLASAERALAAGRLATPEGDNAVYWFNSVLRLQPSNVQARTGLQQVLVNYAQWVREALAAGKTDQAAVFLQRGLQLDPASPLLRNLQNELAKARAEVRQRQAQTVQGSLVKVNGRAMDVKSPELLAELKRLAIAAKAQDAMVLIVARNDAEGRWIYQQMREAVPGYRLRGDIQPGAAPQVSILAKTQ